MREFRRKSPLSSTEVPAEQFAEGVALQFAEEYMESAVYKDVLRELRHHLPDLKGVKLAEMPDLRRHLLADWSWNSVQQVGVGRMTWSIVGGSYEVQAGLL